MARKYIEYYHNVKQHSSSPLALHYAGKEECRKGHYFGPAVRIDYLIHFILSGKGNFTVNDKTYSLTKNQLFVIKPGETSFYIADQEDPWSYIWIGFNGSEVPSLLQNAGLMNDDPIADFEPVPRLTGALEDTIHQFENKEENSYFLLGNLYTIFGCLAKTYWNKNAYKSENVYLKQALNFIHNEYQNHIQVQDICHYLQLDRTYLYRLFMKEFGISPKQYIISYQLQMAMPLILNTDISLKEIAYTCGFSSQSAFSQLFMRKYGRTPGRSRNIDGMINKTWAQKKSVTLPVQDEP